MSSQDELIREIASKHGLSVSPDDPIMILHTINERLLSDSALAQKEQFAYFKSEMEALADRWSRDTKDKAEKIVNASLAIGKKAVVEQIEDSTKRSAAAVKEVVDVSLAQTLEQLQASRRTCWLILCAASLTLVASGLTFWATRA